MNEKIEVWFTYHAPESEQIEHYNALREAAKTFALAIVAHTPPGPDQTVAVRKIREAVMTANASIACKGI